MGILRTMMMTSFPIDRAKKRSIPAIGRKAARSKFLVSTSMDASKLPRIQSTEIDARQLLVDNPAGI